MLELRCIIIHSENKYKSNLVSDHIVSRFFLDKIFRQAAHGCISKWCGQNTPARGPRSNCETFFNNIKSSMKHELFQLKIKFIRDSGITISTMPEHEKKNNYLYVPKDYIIT